MQSKLKIMMTFSASAGPKSRTQARACTQMKCEL